MIFDNSKVFTALNADELKIGSKVIVADSLKDLKDKVSCSTGIVTKKIDIITQEGESSRFVTDDGYVWLLAYLVEEPQGVKWQDLKIGDLVCRHSTISMVVAVDNYEPEDGKPPLRYHICLGHLGWVRDEQLKEWELVMGGN